MPDEERPDQNSEGHVKPDDPTQSPSREESERARMRDDEDDVEGHVGVARGAEALRGPEKQG